MQGTMGLVSWPLACQGALVAGGWLCEYLPCGQCRPRLPWLNIQQSHAFRLVGMLLIVQLL